MTTTWQPLSWNHRIPLVLSTQGTQHECIREFCLPTRLLSSRECENARPLPLKFFIREIIDYSSTRTISPMHAGILQTRALMTTYVNPGILIVGKYSAKLQQVLEQTLPTKRTVIPKQIKEKLTKTGSTGSQADVQRSFSCLAGPFWAHQVRIERETRPISLSNVH